MSNSTVLGESQFKQERASQFTEELLLSSKPGGSIQYVLGAFHLRERNAVRNEFEFPFLLSYLGLAGTQDCCLLKTNGTSRTDATALFGELRYAPTERLQVTIGGRYSRERKGGSNLLDFVGFAVQNNARLDPVVFHAFTPKVSLEYRPSSAAYFYASAGEGFKAGGFNLGSAQNTPYSPERLWSQEIGAKFDLFDRSLRLNLAAFHYDYHNLQVQDVDNNSVLIRNAAAAKVDGIEAEAVADAGRRFRLEAAATFLDARFSRYSTVNTKTPQLGVLDLSGNPLPQAPRWRARFAGEYALPMYGIGTISLRGDASYQDRIFFSNFADPRAEQKAFWWFKARITFMPQTGRYQVAAFADNLTDRRVFTNISITGDLDGSRALGNLAPPRTYGLQLSHSF